MRVSFIELWPPTTALKLASANITERNQQMKVELAYFRSHWEQPRIPCGVRVGRKSTVYGDLACTLVELQEEKVGTVVVPHHVPGY